MEPATIGIIIALTALFILVLVLLFRGQSADVPARLDASLREQFLAFRADMHQEMGAARDEVIRSKDLISDHTIKTIDVIRDMGETLHRIIGQQEEAHKLGQSLKDILQVPKLRGSYGEVILEEMLEKVLPRGIWEMQYAIAGRELVDAVVKIRDIVIPIDAKFPRDDYLRYIEAATPAEKSGFWKNHETAVRNQIRSIREKYIKPEKGTAEFALMFIPSESIYYETIAEKNYLGEPARLYEYAQANNVIPVSPNTFYAFLQVVMMGVRNLDIIKNARELQEGLAALEKSFGLFYNKYEEMGRQIEKIQEAYRLGNNHIERYKRRLDGTLRLEGFREESGALPDKADEEDVI
ncbi:MAG: DNA recombination protein RmuC [Deltaproteobacteria bacterium]|nr:DNA recombination protein RmuC [Deltaproteobacteria bacterium]